MGLAFRGFWGSAQSRIVDDREHWKGSKFGAALVPKRARPRSQPGIPRTPSTRSGPTFVQRFVAVRWTQSAAITNSCELLPSGHAPRGAPLPIYLRPNIGWRLRSRHGRYGTEADIHDFGERSSHRHQTNAAVRGRIILISVNSPG
jgi:hypothetical protein